MPVPIARSHSRFFPLELAGCLCFALLVAAANLCLVLFTEKTTVTIELETPHAGALQLFWRSGSEEFALDRSVLGAFEPPSSRLHFTIPRVVLADLRIDPGNYPGRILIRELTFSHSLFGRYAVDLAAYPSTSPQTAGVTSLTYLPDRGLVFTVTNDDPVLIFPADDRLADFQLLGTWLLGALAGGTLLYVFLRQRQLKGSRWQGEMLVELQVGPPEQTGQYLITVLKEHLVGLKLLESSCTGSIKRYRFAFADGRACDLERLAERLRQASAVVTLRIQYHRSGEV